MFALHFCHSLIFIEDNDEKQIAVLRTFKIAWTVSNIKLIGKSLSFLSLVL